jgi:hypothetical protein
MPQCISFVFAFHCSTHKPPTAVDTSTLALRGTTTANWLREQFCKFFVPMCTVTNFLAINLKKTEAKQNAINLDKEIKGSAISRVRRLTDRSAPSHFFSSRLITTSS